MNRDGMEELARAVTRANYHDGGQPTAAAVIQPKVPGVRLATKHPSLMA